MHTLLTFHHPLTWRSQQSYPLTAGNYNAFHVGESDRTKAAIFGKHLIKIGIRENVLKKFYVACHKTYHKKYIGVLCHTTI